MTRTVNSNRLRPLEILLTPGFLLGLTLLLLNDFYLKQTYGNFLTGKLSDLSGLFTFSLFLSALFPNRLLLVHTTSAAAFVWWKTPLADGFIDAWNSFGIMSVARTVDYSDSVALIVLPLSYAYFAIALTDTSARLHSLRQAGVYLVLIVSVFAFGATSSASDRTVTLPETYAVQESRVEIEGVLLKDERIKDLVPHVTRTMPQNGTNIKLDQPLHYFEFKVQEKICDSPLARMSFMITERGGHTELAAISIDFECRDYQSEANINGLDKSYIIQTRNLFKREILSKLTPVEPNDQTPRSRPRRNTP